MSFTSAKLELEQYFEARYSVTPVEYDNASLSDFSAINEWVRFVTISSSAEQIAFGFDMHRYSGLVVVQIFIRPDIGTKRAYEICDLISAIYRSKTIGTYTFRVPEAIVVGESGSWYQLNLIIPFWRQE